MRVFLFLVLIVTITNLYAQKIGLSDSTKVDVVAIDSLQEEQVNAVTLLSIKADSIKRADSLSRVQLLSQLEKLKTTDNLQKVDLLNKLKDIEQVDSIRRALRIARIDSLKSSTPGFPIVPFNDTLFYIYTKLGPFSPRDRASTITKKIQLLLNESEDLPVLSILESDETTDVVANDEIILSITSDDAIWVGTTRQGLALVYKNAIETSINDFYQDNTLKKILIRIGRVLLVVVILFVIVFYVNRVFRYFKAKLYAQKGKLIKGVKIKNYEFLTAYRLIQVIFAGLNFAKILVIILAFYLSLPILFSIFPGTKNIADKLFGYFLTPLTEIFNGVIAYLPNLITIGVIYIIIHYLIRFFKFLSEEIEEEELVLNGFYADWARPTFNIIRFALYAFMFVVIWPYLPGSDSQVFQGVTIFVGLLISLGSTSAISNMVAGLVITYMRPFKIGDKVKIGEVSGEVLEKSLLVTRLRTIKNEDITVPNASVLSGYTVNYSSVASDMGLILHTTVTIGYDVPWAKVHELLIKAASETDLLLENKKPFVLQTSLDDFYVSYQINVYTQYAEKMVSIKSDLHQRIQDAFNQAGIEIMSPHYRANRDGSSSTVVHPDPSNQ